jgi:hypothetical protein
MIERIGGVCTEGMALVCRRAEPVFTGVSILLQDPGNMIPAISIYFCIFQPNFLLVEQI